MPTRNVVLTDRQDQFVTGLVESGRYQNASEVLREGMRLLERREAEDDAKLQSLRKAVEIGLAALDRGEFEEFEDAKSLRAYLNEHTDRVIEAASRR
jgi:antitoxin ParD1/3/4